MRHSRTPLGSGLSIQRNLLGLVVLSLSLSSCYASVLEFQRISRPKSTGGRLAELVATPDSLGTSGPGKEDNWVANHGDVRYSTNITLGGENYVVALDTGSTDLWVHPVNLDAVGSFNETRIPLELQYGDGSYGVRGTIATAPFQMGSFNVSQQAFLHVNYSNVGGLSELGIDGVLGLAFDFISASPINQAIKARQGHNATWGASPLQNIFNLNTSARNFIAIDLARTDDLEDTAGGSFAIGEYAKQWEDVAKAPKLEQYPNRGDRWTTVLGGIVIDGKEVNVTTSIGNGVSGGGIVTLLDTGDPTAVLPERLRDGIYERVPGAVPFFQRGVKYWVVPCNTTMVVEFEFGGQRFPIHPLDLSVVRSVTAGGNQYTACIGTIQGIDGVGGRAFEAVLGDIFLRNVYSVYDFGDLQANGTVGEPYMQLLAQTNSSIAVMEVSAIRNRTMANLPLEVPPTQLIDLLEAEGPSVATSDSDAASCDPAYSSGESSPTPSNSLEALVPREPSTPAEATSTSIKRDPLMVSLLVANLIVGLAVLVFGVLNYVRKGPLVTHARTRSGPHYVPVRASQNPDSASVYTPSTQAGPFMGHYEELEGHSRSPSVSTLAV